MAEMNGNQTEEEKKQDSAFQSLDTLLQSW